MKFRLMNATKATVLVSSSVWIYLNMYWVIWLLQRCDFDDINYCNLYYKTQLIVAGVLGLHGVTALLKVLPSPKVITFVVKEKDWTYVKEWRLQCHKMGVKSAQEKLVKWLIVLFLIQKIAQVSIVLVFCLIAIIISKNICEYWEGAIYLFLFYRVNCQ